MGKDILVEATSKLPFAGRHGVRSMYMSGREAARQGNYAKKAGSMAYLGFMVAVHAYQAKLGVDAGLHHLHEDGILNAAEAGYDTLYSAANAAVTYTQARLLGKLSVTTSNNEMPKPTNTDTLTNDDATPADDARHDMATAENAPSFTNADLPRDIAVTLGGQALFIATAIFP